MAVIPWPRIWQFVGGASGWIRANMGLYLLLGPGVGGIVAGVVGLNEANR